MKKLILTQLGIAIFASLTLSSCTSNANKLEGAHENLEEAKREAAEDVAEAEKELREARRAYTDDVNEKIRHNEDRIATLEERAKNAKGEAKIKYDQFIADAKRSNNELKAKMERSANVANDNWEEFKVDFDRSMKKAGDDIEDFFTNN